MQTNQSNESGAELTRLEEDREGRAAWKKWGPYLSERQWGTVREDYSSNGDAWNYFTHDNAQDRAYRWGEDGLAGISDNRQLLCFALALWNGRDPILKERLFGLTNSEGNHGEDVKEYYFYLDSTPTHSYMKYLYSGIREPELKIMDVFVCRSRKKIARPTGGNHYIEDGMGSRLYPSRAHPHRWDGHSRCDMRVCSHSPVSFPAVSTMLRPRMQPS